MEVFNTEMAAFILDVQQDYLRELTQCQDIGYIGNYENPRFTWNYLERYIAKNDDIGIFEAQRRIADKVWADETVLV